jgi:DNA-binding response OmpR family regulator
MLSLQSSGGLRNILVVDDQPMVRQSLRRNMQTHGHLVLEAETVEQAMTMLRDMPVDAVVLDIRLNEQGLEEQSGLEVLRFIRAQPQMAKLPVLILTAFAPTTTQQGLINEYGAMVFYKPVGYRAVLHHLTRVLTKH